jgi:hypothetical protein
MHTVSSVSQAMAAALQFILTSKAPHPLPGVLPPIHLSSLDTLTNANSDPHGHLCPCPVANAWATPHPPASPLCSCHPAIASGLGVQGACCGNTYMGAAVKVFNPRPLWMRPSLTCWQPAHRPACRASAPGYQPNRSLLCTTLPLITPQLLCRGHTRPNESVPRRPSLNSVDWK